MKKKFVSLLLALVMCLGLLPASASAAEENLPDWYFLFAVFKNIDADCKDKDGKIVRAKYTMTREEVDAARNSARQFEAYMDQVGVMRAHVDVVEIDATLTELDIPKSGASGIGSAQAAPLLEEKVDLDRYDHVTCIASLNVSTGYLGMSGGSYENGAGNACINTKNQAFCLKNFSSPEADMPPGTYLHEFMHFMEIMSRKWGASFNLHRIQSDIYPGVSQGGAANRRACYDDIILDRVKGNAETGTGVHPAAWQYPPHVLRTMTEWNVRSGVTGIGEFAFADNKTLTRVYIPSSVAGIGGAAFQGCSNLTSISLPATITRIEGYTFANCVSLTDVYYGGSEAQWKAIPIGTSNSALSRAAIHYNHLLADVKTTDPFAPSIAWALGNGATGGTGGGKFFPGSPCTQAQILTFLWRAKGSPAPAGAVSGGKYYASAVQWAKEQGLIDGTFSADAPCTRAEAVTYLWKQADSPAAKAASFTDVPAGAGYAKAVDWAVEKGVTSGTGAAAFSPDAVCTRGQIVTFLYRALG